MTKMFPDSGVPASDAANSLPDVNTVGACDELWYSTSRCQPRFDPAAANAELAELLNIMARASIPYDCSVLDNLQLGIRYLIQRGLENGATTEGGPLNYTTGFTPPLTTLNNFLTVVIVPNQDNLGPVWLNAGAGGGLRPVFRNDGENLQAHDWRANKPVILSYWNSAWHHMGLVFSQVPSVADTIDAWVRTDGNDVTGDGTANSPDKAFRTINGAWAKITSRYSSSPRLTVNIRLGIPGDYAGGSISNFGGRVSVIGDPSNRTAYRLTSEVAVGTSMASLYVGNASVVVQGLTLLRNGVSPNSVNGALFFDATMQFIDVVFDNSPGASGLGNFITAINSSFGFTNTIEFNGRSITQENCIAMNYGAVSSGGVNPTDQPMYFTNVHASNAMQLLQGVSVLSWHGETFIETGCTGVRYNISENSILNMGGRTPPGSAAGVVATGAQFIA